MSDRPCIRECGRPARPGKRRCGWCILKESPISDQIQAMDAQCRAREARPGFEYLARVKPALWPEGYRWCSGCQAMVPLDYVRGSMCIAHASAANHQSHMSRTYSLAPGEYEALLAFQNGRCYVCGKQPRKRRLAVDHDHSCCPGEISCGRCVRGLLCAADERGCNYAVVGNLEGAVWGLKTAVARLAMYVATPPFRLMKNPALRSEVGEPGVGNDPPF
jgi:hypothetical protein